MLEKWFKLKENNTTAKTEVMAGITTFMTMAYILAVNPTMLAAAGMDKTAVLIATALASLLVPWRWRSLQIIRLHWHRGWD